MHHQAGRLVDDDDVVVLIDNVERDILALRLRRHRLGDVDCDRISSGDMISGVADGGAFGGDGAGQNQRLQPRARQAFDGARQHAVEPGRALVARDRHVKPLAV